MVRVCAVVLYLKTNVYAGILFLGNGFNFCSQMNKFKNYNLYLLSALFSRDSYKIYFIVGIKEPLI